MSETWMHVIKNAVAVRGEGNYPSSPKLGDIASANNYLERVLASGDKKTREILLEILETTDSEKVKNLPGLVELIHTHHALTRQRLIDMGMTTKGPRDIDDIYNNWI